MKAIWEISLFHLHRLPSELPEHVTFEELRIANYLVAERRKFESEVCESCMKEFDTLVHTCPICKADWQNVEKRDPKTGSMIRSKRFLKGTGREAKERRKAWFGNNDVPE